MTVRETDYTDFAHTGPGTLAGRYLRMFWQPIYVARDLEPGQAVSIRVMGEDLRLHRDEGGEVCIPNYPAQEYLGLVFAYLAEGLPPEMPRYRDFEDEGVLTISTYVRDCNWFQNLENVVDEVHVAFTHRVSEFGNHGLYVVPEVSAEESEWGVTMSAKRPGEMVRVTQLGLPNIANVCGSPTTDESGWEDFIAWRVPIDDTVHRSFNVHIAHVKRDLAYRYREAAAQRRANRPDSPANAMSQRVLRGEVAWPDIEHRPDIVGIQDYVSQVGQGVIADRGKEHLGKSDVGIILLRQIYARELRALAEDRPLKNWCRGEGIRTAAGAV